MRFKGMSLFSLAMVLTATSGYAKSEKYDRAKPSTKTPATSSANPAPAVTSPDSGASAPDKKVDLTDLENRYWTAKDTEFKVVQNRLYTKAEKFAFTPMAGLILNDQYNSAYNFGLAVNYFFSERHGVELQGWMTTSSNSTLTSDFTGYGAMPDHNDAKLYIGANYNWVPIYAKISLLDEKILYFDLSVSPGVGVTQLKTETFKTTVTNPEAITQTAPTLALDIAQHFYLNENIALRIDLKNHMYPEKIYKSSDTRIETRSRWSYSSTFMIGVTIRK